MAARLKPEQASISGHWNWPMLAANSAKPLVCCAMKSTSRAGGRGQFRIWACAAAVQATGTDWALVSERLDGVLSTPAFLREVAGAELVVL